MITLSVYALTDPVSGEIRYVGLSRDVKKRLQFHLCRPLACTREWILSLKDQGLRPGVIILESGIAEDEAYQHERDWMGYLNSKFPLLNHHIFYPCWDYCAHPVMRKWYEVSRHLIDHRHTQPTK